MSKKRRKSQKGPDKKTAGDGRVSVLVDDEKDKFMPFQGLDKKKALAHSAHAPQKNTAKKKVIPTPTTKIVERFEEEVTFADIYDSWENGRELRNVRHRTRGKSENVTPSKVVGDQDFGAILEAWEKKGEVTPVRSQKKEPSHLKSKSYQPTKDFGAILSDFNGTTKKTQAPSTPQKETQKKAKTPTNNTPRIVKEEVPSSYRVIASNKSSDKSALKKSTTESPSGTSLMDKLLNPKKFKEDAKKKKEKEKKERAARLAAEKQIRKAKKAQLVEERRKEREEKKRIAALQPVVTEKGEPVAWSEGGKKAIAPETRKPSETEYEEKVVLKPQEKPFKSPEYKPKQSFGEIIEKYHEVQEKEKQNKDKKVDRSFQEILNDYDKVKKVAPPVSSPKKPQDPQKSESQQEKSEEVASDTPDFSDIYKMWSQSSPSEKAQMDEMLEKQREPHNTYVSINHLRAMEPEAEIDLHGDTAEIAGLKAREFLVRNFENGKKKVSIITGKGLHSENGKSVLKDVVVSEIRLSGLVREASHPKEMYGGSGAIWIIYKTKKRK